MHVGVGVCVMSNLSPVVLPACCFMVDWSGQRTAFEQLCGGQRATLDQSLPFALHCLMWPLSMRQEAHVLIVMVHSSFQEQWQLPFVLHCSEACISQCCHIASNNTMPSLMHNLDNSQDACTEQNAPGTINCFVIDPSG